MQFLRASLFLSVLAAQSAVDPVPEHPAIRYFATPPNDPIAQLNTRLVKGEAHLEFAGPSGYLRSVLSALRIPLESQLVIFSKTSLQADLISPSNPRTIYFNDSVAIGWVPGEPFVEAAAQDPRQGVNFYILNQHIINPPQFLRADFCLTCHISHATFAVPGMMVRSVFPGPTGLAQRPLGEYTSDHRSPFSERWGGWFVTGRALPAHHMGNTTFTDPSNPARQAHLELKLPPATYLAPTSDVVALMVFEHQMRCINLLTLYGWQIRTAAHDHLPFDLDPPARKIADYLLFIDEPPLDRPVKGSSGFAESFTALGLRDKLGRSLKDLDLKHRLMRYPCSYLIYSPAFDALPADGRQAIYKRLWQILSGQDRDPKYARLSAPDRRAVIEILRDTKPGLPDYFSQR